MLNGKFIGEETKINHFLNHFYNKTTAAPISSKVVREYMKFKIMQFSEKPT